MANSYYTPSGQPTSASRGRSINVREEFALVEDGFDAVETAVNLKAPKASPTFTGTVVLPADTTIGNVSPTELTYLDGVTSAIQTQLNAKAPTASPTFTGTITNNGGQIRFPAVQAASANANTLDDYEEGSFSVTAENAGNPIALTTDTGFYVKVGKVVHVWINAAWSSTSGGGQVQVNNLPFASQATGITVLAGIPATTGAYIGPSASVVFTDLNATGGAQALYLAGSYLAVN